MESKAKRWAKEKLALSMPSSRKSTSGKRIASVSDDGGVWIGNTLYDSDDAVLIAQWFKETFLEPDPKTTPFGSVQPKWEDVTPEWAAKETRETRRRKTCQTIRACAQAGHSHASMLKQGNADLASELRKKGFTVTEEQQSQYYKISW